MTAGKIFRERKNFFTTRGNFPGTEKFFATMGTLPGKEKIFFAPAATYFFSHCKVAVFVHRKVPLRGWRMVVDTERIFIPDTIPIAAKSVKRDEPP